MPENKSVRFKPLIIGASGKVGQLFASAFKMSGIKVDGIDLRRLKSCDRFYERFNVANANDFSERTRETISNSNCVMVCLPYAAGLKCVQVLLKNILRPGVLLVDTLSVKSEIASNCQIARSNRIEFLSINPLFGPQLGFQGQTIAAVPLRSGRLSKELIRIFESWGTEVLVLTANEHDTATATMQVGAHAILFAIASLFTGMERNVPLGRCSTPVSRTLAALVCRLVFGNPQLYWEIQHFHPYAEQTRKALISALRELDKLAHQKSCDAFRGAILQKRSRIKELNTQKQAILHVLQSHPHGICSTSG